MMYAEVGFAGIRGLRLAPVPTRKPHPAMHAPDRVPWPWTKPGSFVSYRSGWAVPFHGPLRLDFLMVMETSPSVTAIQAWPIELDCWDGTRPFVHVPDFLVVTRNGKFLADVEADRTAATPDGVARYAAVKAAARRAGFRHRVFTERSARVEPRLGNARVICREHGFRASAEERRAVLAAVEALGEASAGEVADLCGLKRGRAFRVLLNLAWRCLVRTDMGTPINHRSRFRKTA